MTERAFLPVRIAVLTVSDTRTAADDRSGDTLVERLTGAGHALAARAILPDDRGAIADRLRAWIADPQIDVIDQPAEAIAGDQQRYTCDAVENDLERARTAWDRLCSYDEAGC